MTAVTGREDGEDGAAAEAWERTQAPAGLNLGTTGQGV